MCRLPTSLPNTRFMTTNRFLLYCVVSCLKFWCLWSVIDLFGSMSVTLNTYPDLPNILQRKTGYKTICGTQRYADSRILEFKDIAKILCKVTSCFSFCFSIHVYRQLGPARRHIGKAISGMQTDLGYFLLSLFWF